MEAFGAAGVTVSHGGGLMGDRAGRPMSAGLYSDEVPALLQKGEFVVRKKAVQHIGVDNLKAMNAGVFHDGGMVTDAIANVAGAGYAAMSGTISAGIGTSNKLMDAYKGSLQNRILSGALGAVAAAGSTAPPDGYANNGDLGAGAKYVGKIGSVASALGFLNSQVQSGSTAWKQLCERLARTAYGLPGMFPSARAHFNAVPNAFRRGTNTAGAPAGALGFWNTGPYGHIAVSAGGGNYYTNLSNGTVGVRSAANLNAWGQVMGVTEPWWSNTAYADLPQLNTGGHILKDNVMANLHNGEVVLTKPLARDLQAGISSMNPDARRDASYSKTENWNINVDGRDEKSSREIVSGIMKEVEKRDRQMRGKRVI